MSLSSDILRGHTEAVILNVLRKGDSYGYEITKEIKEKTKGMFDIKEATIYIAFRRMEADGLISTYWGDGVGGAKRRYYSITAKGKDAYTIALEEWKLSKGLLDDLIGG